MARETKFKKGVFQFTSKDALKVNGTLEVVGATTQTGKLTRKGETITPSAVTATADGLTTGLITAAMGNVNVTSANAAHLVTLPAAAAGIKMDLWVNSTGCKIVTPAASTVKINNVNADGTNKLTVAVGEHVTLLCVATTEWKAERWTIAGASTTAVPA